MMKPLPLKTDEVAKRAIEEKAPEPPKEDKTEEEVPVPEEEDKT